jgi:uridine kinase
MQGTGTYLIGIGGDSGAGKTTLTAALCAMLRGCDLAVLSGDDMHLWERGDAHWNDYTHLNPVANDLQEESRQLAALKNGKPVLRRHYSHVTGRFTEPVEVYPRQVLLYEGLHPYYLTNTRELFDVRVFLKPEQQLTRHWKIQRDTTVRGYTREQVMNQIIRREKDSALYIDVQAQHAELLVEILCLEPLLNLGHPDESPAMILRLTVGNGWDFGPLMEVLRQTGMRVEHAYLLNDLQKMEISGAMSGLNLQGIAAALGWEEGYAWLKDAGEIPDLIAFTLLYYIRQKQIEVLRREDGYATAA